MSLVIKVQSKVVQGLETWVVSVNGTQLSQHLSEAGARSKMKACIHAWNIEKIHTKKAG
jgi:hypothetical protein